MPLGPAERLARVRRFWEKPTPALAALLWGRGSLWNSFVLVGGIPALLALFRGAVPGLYSAMAALRSSLGSGTEAERVRRLYDAMRPVDFSRDVLAVRPANLAVLPVSGVDWNDLGEPRRVLATMARVGFSPHWLEPVASAS